MTDAERLAGLRFDGIQFGPQPTQALALATDPLTGTTFALHDGETLGEALARIDRRFAAALRTLNGEAA